MFEADVQASFAVLMLSGGYCPCLPPWPIVEIKLQGAYRGYKTDDIIIVVENTQTKERNKLLGQIKTSIAINASNEDFSNAIQAAWSDFCNPSIFTNNKDIIAIITGPLSAVDTKSINWLINHAMHVKDAKEFFLQVKQAYFCSNTTRVKLKVIRNILTKANNGNAISDQLLYKFIKNFRLLVYDIHNESSFNRALLLNQIANHSIQDPRNIWARLVTFVQEKNINAATITVNSLPEDIKKEFTQKNLKKISVQSHTSLVKHNQAWTKHKEARRLALVALVGCWDDNNKNDTLIISKLLNINYKKWRDKAVKILHDQNSPLTFNDGIWKIEDKVKLLELLGSFILDEDIKNFTKQAVSVLKEIDPAFELSTEERIMANVRGKVMKQSQSMRKGVAEGLAILGNYPKACTKCSPNYVENASTSSISKILDRPIWKAWGSLDLLLPDLAEAAPEMFLNVVTKMLRIKNCPFDELFKQESGGITGRSYIGGLLWALEGLAWDEKYIVRACIALGELAKHDPGGYWHHRPADSLAIIFRPWLPQTFASFK